MKGDAVGNHMSERIEVLVLEDEEVDWQRFYVDQGAEYTAYIEFMSERLAKAEQRNDEELHDYRVLGFAQALAWVRYGASWNFLTTEAQLALGVEAEDMIQHIDNNGGPNPTHPEHQA